MYTIYGYYQDVGKFTTDETAYTNTENTPTNDIADTST